MSETNSSDSRTLKGVVKWFNNSKGFGFIEHPSGKDVFVHYSVISSDGYKTLTDGEPVEYEIEEGPKGYHAVKVSRTGKPTDKATSSDTDSNTDANSSQSNISVSSEVKN